MASGSGNGLDFKKKKFIIKPKEIHKATIVWLHDIGLNGRKSREALRNLENPNIKWICITAPKRPLTLLDGKKTNAWFDVYGTVSESMQEDLGSLNYVTTYIALLLSSEPPYVMKGVGGIGIGAAQALFYASSYVLGRVPIEVNFVIGTNGWLPDWKSLQPNMSRNSGSSLRAASLRILVTNGCCMASNDVVPSEFVNKYVEALCSAGFQITFKPCGWADAFNEIRNWLVQNIQ